MTPFLLSVLHKMVRNVCSHAEARKNTDSVLNFCRIIFDAAGLYMKSV